MYSKIVTVFNYYESKTTGDAYWYSHVLSGVDLITEQYRKSTKEILFG